MYLPFLVQAPMRLTTLGWSPTLTMIFSSFKRSRLLSSVVAFSAKQKETGRGNNIIGMYEQNCAMKDGTPLTGVKKSQETAKPHCKELIEKKKMRKFRLCQERII